MKVERISAITLKVRDMRASLRFYRDVLGLRVMYGGEEASFSSLSMEAGESVILNLEE